MNNKEFVNKIIDVANNYKTLYVMGCFGAPMTEANKTRYCSNHSYNKKAARQAMIKAASADTFGFDCVNLIKGVLWGWNGDKTKTYGGAKYAVNGVPDVSADGMIAKCSNVSTDFTHLEIGEAVWCPGHIGVYIGDGLAVECTPAWKNCVQITACNCTKAGYNRRNWTKHGKMPYITYTESEVPAITFIETPIALVGTVKVNGSLNIRKQPTTNSDIIGKHANGDVVTICAKTDNGWYKVEYPTIGTGYISAQYVNAVPHVVDEPVIEAPIVKDDPLDNTPDAWAKDAIQSAIDKGILFGDDKGNLKLHRECTRQEAIIFLYRLYNTLHK